MVTVAAKISNYQLLLLLHTSITELSVLRNACLGGAVDLFRVVAHEQSLLVNNRFKCLFFSIVIILFPFFPSGSSVGNLLTRWDVSSNPGNWDFSSNRLHGRRGKGTAESFSREK